METENTIFESSEWQSTPEIIKITFKSLFDLTQTHSAIIKQLEEQIATKSSKTELLNALATKQNSADVMRNISDINSKLEQKATNEDIKMLSNDYKAEISLLKSEIDQMKKQIDTKANKSKVIDALHKKANKTNVNDITTIIDNITQNVSEIKNDISNIKNDFNTKIDDIVTIINELNDNKISNDNMTSIKEEIIKESEASLREYKSQIDEMISLKTNSISDDIIANASSQLTLKETISKIINDSNNILSEVQKLKDEIHSISNSQFANSSSISLLSSQLPEIKQSISRKVDLNEVTFLLQNKLDISHFKTSIASKPSVDEVHSMISEMLSKAFNDYTVHINDILPTTSLHNEISNLHMTIGEIKDALIMKVNIKEINSMLSNKVDLSTFNSAIDSITEELNAKTNEEDFNEEIQNQKKITSLLCGINIIGEWKWNFSQLANAFIVWDTQTVNTSPDNFYWEKNRNYITIRDKGTYIVECVIFSEEKINMRIVIDNNYVESGEKINCNNGMYGVMIREVVNVEDRTRLSVAIAAESAMKGKGILRIKNI